MPDVTEQLHRYADRLETCVPTMTADEVVGPPAARPRPSGPRARTSWIAAAAVLVLVLVGGVVAARARDASVAGSDASDELRPQVDGREFWSTSVREHGEDRPVLALDGSPTGHLTIAFEGDRVTWSTVCRRSSTSFTIDGDRLVLPDVVEVKGMGCPTDVAAQDSWFSWVMTERPEVVLDGEVLTVRLGDADRIELLDRAVVTPTTTASTTAPAAALGGTRWHLDHVEEPGVSWIPSPGIDPPQGPQSLSFGVPAGTDGASTVGVYDGCNRSNGHAAIGPATIDFSERVGTYAGCADGLDEAADLLATLLGPTTYEVADGTLRIAVGERVIVFRPA